MKEYYNNFLIYNKNRKTEINRIDYLLSLFTKWCKQEFPVPTKKLNFQDSGIKLDSNLIEIAKKYLKKSDVNPAFEQFELHHTSKNSLFSDWSSAFELWCSRYNNYKLSTPKITTPQSKKAQEKADYRWDFRKAKDISDKIKSWLDFDVKVKWMDKYYWKDIFEFSIPTRQGDFKIGWKEVMHPDFNKKEILLYKIDSTDDNFMLEHKSDEIIDAEVLEND